MKRVNTQRHYSRLRRHRRIRSRIRGISSCPRLSVYKSLRYLYVQVIDDTRGHTLVSRSSEHDKTMELFGKSVAEACLAKNISRVVFDRGGFPYTGTIKTMADAAREHGLKF